MEAIDTFIPEPERDIDKPFLMPVGGRVLDHGPGDGSDGPDRTRDREAGRGSGAGGDGSGPQDGGNGGGDVPEAAGRGAGRGTTRDCC